MWDALDSTPAERDIQGRDADSGGVDKKQLIDDVPRHPQYGQRTNSIISLASPTKEMGVMMTMPLPAHLNTIQDQARYLHMVKGMTIQDIIEEIESRLKGKLPENIKDMLQTESKYWG